MAPSVLGVGNGVLFIPNSTGESGPIASFYSNDTQSGTPVEFLETDVVFPDGNSGVKTIPAINQEQKVGSVIVPAGGANIYFSQWIDLYGAPPANPINGFFSRAVAQTDPQSIGGLWQLWTNANRLPVTSPNYEEEWTYWNNPTTPNAGQWSPVGFANRVQTLQFLPQGTYWIKIQGTFEKTSPQGDFKFNTRISAKAS
jgi:hypothetical protein